MRSNATFQGICSMQSSAMKLQRQAYPLSIPEVLARAMPRGHVLARHAYTCRQTVSSAWCCHKRQPGLLCLRCRLDLCAGKSGRQPGIWGLARHPARTGMVSRGWHRHQCDRHHHQCGEVFVAIWHLIHPCKSRLQESASALRKALLCYEVIFADVLIAV